MIAIKSEAKLKRHKEDAFNLIILLLIALLLGIYLITTTILITQDGVFYINRAQKLSTDPKSAIISHPPGYPFLLFVAFKFVGLFNDSSSAQTLAYTAQSMTLLCRLLSIIPLYYIGKLLVGSRNSFWALLILIFLPYPAKFGSDVLRDWPHILFLAIGFLFLLWGAKEGRWRFFCITGLITGLGFTVRPECAQLIIYGILWLLIKIIIAKCNMSRIKLLFALFILLIGFAIPFATYTLKGGRTIPHKLRYLMVSSEKHNDLNFQNKSEEKTYNYDFVNRIISLFSIIIKAIMRLIGEISDNLMYYFLPALLIGIYYRFRRKNLTTAIEKFFLPVFIVLNIIMMILLHYSQGYISRRHCLPLVLFSVFYVPIGLHIFAESLSQRFLRGGIENKPKLKLCFFILVAIGVTICLPKLLTPLRIEKKGYRDVAKWLEKNTAKDDLIIVPDLRISFYAEREGLDNKFWQVNQRVNYIVEIIKAEDDSKNILKNFQVEEVYSVSLDKRKHKNKLVICKVI
jgi:hypothetical protein